MNSGAQDNEFTRLKELIIPALCAASFNMDLGLSEQPAQSWDIFKSELCRIRDKGTERLVSSIYLAKCHIEDYRDGKAQLPPPSRATAVLKFLQGCEPSLSYLLPDFIDAGVDREDWIIAMQDWPVPALSNFLQSFNKTVEGEYDEKKVVLEALLIRFTNY
ncbi:hypothetical protein C8J57DRAFT_1317124 [Mycena rebaudengoi]|nr:hypothetical protein C8J57DRAFT_1317124 [Mycena rebaudengoi]